jgi:hypothetical protein
MREADAVYVLREMVSRLKLMERETRMVISKLEALPVKRRGWYARDVLLADLMREADKTNDSLTVYGFYERVC